MKKIKKKILATDLHRLTQTKNHILFTVCVSLCKSVAKKMEDELWGK